MRENKIIKFLIISCVILSAAGGFLFWQRGWLNQKLIPAADIFNLSNLSKLSFLKMIPEISGFNEEKTYLLLFQNNLELRPSGGYIGNFGILKVKNGRPTAFEIHDTNIFDGFGKIKTELPQPLKDHLKIDNWQMRDGNWSPDFEISAKQVEYFYQIQGGQEKFDGIIGINAALLPDLLELTGPVYLEDFDKEFESNNVLRDLEYEVEKGYIQRNIEPGERKKIFKSLIKNILEKLIQENSWLNEKYRNFVIKELEEKNLLLYFKDSDIQKIAADFNWGGRVDTSYQDDYLMLVEANLGSRKSNAFIERQIDYSVDFAKEKPEAKLKIKYIHQDGEKDWFNDDYRFYLRIYTPLGTWLENTNGIDNEIEFINEFNKTVFANWIEVPAGQEKTIEFTYTLPKKINQELRYRILVQKQSGMDIFPFKLTLKKGDQKEYIKDEIITKDWEGVIFFEE